VKTLQTKNGPAKKGPGRVSQSIADLYERDETAWLERMAELVAKGQLAEPDYQHLAEYLTDMATRDRREVKSRLIVLLTHLLKWQFQVEGQSASWRGTIREQRLQLQLLLESSTLRKHAEAVLADAYAHARKLAAGETGVRLARFPKECSWTIDELLSDD
jgi:hypothetical protein